MISLGKKLAALRKDKKWSQTELAAKMNTSVSVISRYERDRMKPSADAAKRLADLLGSTVGYLLGDSADNDDFFKDPATLERFKAINAFSKEDQDKIWFTIDALIHEVNNRKRYASK